MSAGNLHIGTAGWNYRHWQGAFYPKDLPQKKWQEFYMERFHTVEVNNTFYRLPEKKTFEKWGKDAAEGFIFSVKASRYITHMKKLKDPEQPVANFLDHAGILGEKLGPVLFQLPPRWKSNPPRLESFLASAPSGYRFAFEFRDPSWWEDRVFDILKKYNASFCAFDLGGMEAPAELTSDFAYIRLHGQEAEYQGQYDDETLSAWAECFEGWLDQGIDVFCYFDNDENGYAAKDALRLKEKLGRKFS